MDETATECRQGETTDLITEPEKGRLIEFRQRLLSTRPIGHSYYIPNTRDVPTLGTGGDVNQSPLDWQGRV